MFSFSGQVAALAVQQFKDRKSTRLNSSHSQISYAVFCLKKKKQIHDERGYLMEMLRTDWPEFERVAQSYITIGYPGIVKGWHYHKNQTDHFVVVRATAKVVCYDNRDRSPTKGKVNEFFPGERNPMLIKIPPYVVHGFKAVGPEPVYLVNFPTQLDDYKEPDEFRIPYDSKDIPYDWDGQMKWG